MEIWLAIAITLFGLFGGMFVIWKKPGSGLPESGHDSEGL